MRPGLTEQAGEPDHQYLIPSAASLCSSNCPGYPWSLLGGHPANGAISHSVGHLVEKKIRWRASEMIQQLRGLPTLPEDLGSIAGTCKEAHSHLWLQFQGMRCPLLKGTRHACGAGSYMQVNHSYNILKILK